jgi:hypothetical protein
MDMADDPPMIEAIATITAMRMKPLLAPSNSHVVDFADLWDLSRDGAAVIVAVLANRIFPA